MIPTDYKDFLMAVVTSSASFIGLLFVAVNFIIDRNGKSKVTKSRENMLAEGSYVALIDIFFISLVGLLPDTEVGHVMIVMGLIGLGNSFSMLRSGIKTSQSWGAFSISTAVYLGQVVYGLHLIMNSHNLINTSILVTMIIVLFSSALGRAWELTGISN